MLGGGCGGRDVSGTVLQRSRGKTDSKKLPLSQTSTVGVGVGGQGEEMALGSAGTRLRDKVTGCKSQEPSASESLLGSW